MAKSTQIENKEDKKNVIYILTYFFGWLSGIIVYFLYGKENSRLKANAIQAILLSLTSIILAIIISPIGLLINIFMWIYGLYVGVKAYNMEDVSIPFISDYAKRHSGHGSAKKAKTAKEKPTKQTRAEEEDESQESDALKALKMRYARGEITKRKYNAMKKELE